MTVAGLRNQHPRRVFRDRREAGQVLAGLLQSYRGKPGVLVLGLARGGIPVAYEVANALASGGRVVVNDDMLRALRITRSNCAKSPIGKDAS